MENSEGYCVVLCACSGDEEAERIALLLVENRLAACVQVMPVRSFYEWEGKVHRDEERLLFIKARAAMYPRIEELISGSHSYKVPEIIRIPIESGLRKYLDWIDSVSR
jgi:periplasmic divalent cation tolerance protein